MRIGCMTIKTCCAKLYFKSIIYFKIHTFSVNRVVTHYMWLLLIRSNPWSFLVGSFLFAIWRFSAYLNYNIETHWKHRTHPRHTKLQISNGNNWIDELNSATSNGSELIIKQISTKRAHCGKIAKTHLCFALRC